MMFGKKSYKKWAGNDMIKIFIIAISLIVFKFILSPIYFMTFVVSLFFLLNGGRVIIMVLEVIIYEIAN